MSIKNRLLVISTVAIAGICAHAQVLAEDTVPKILKGEYIHWPTNRLILDFAEQRYEAKDFKVSSSQDLAALRKQHYGVDQKKWDRVSSGHDPSHKSYSVNPVLKAPDGKELICRLAWKFGDIPSGTCADSSNKEFQVEFD